MNKVTMKEFYEKQGEFLRKHETVNVYRSNLINESYTKHYIANDGAEMWEHNRVITEEVEVEVRGIKCKVLVKLWESECWSTDDSQSMYLYQQI